MVFSSLPFLFIFFPITFILYYSVPSKIKNIILLVASLIFYAWGEPIYIFLMLITCLVGYFTALIFEKYPTKKKVILLLTVIFDLGVLGFFKYANFLIYNINNIFNISLSTLELSLPIGISFYTFQILSYSIDVYKNDVKAEKNFFNFVTYVALFPQLIAGPIVRYKTINDELHSRKITLENISLGFSRFIVGLSKKVLLANNIGLLFTTISSSLNISSSMAWLGTFAFGLQIYFDFSGYSDMSIGMGKMLGFTFLENFNYPYVADSITDFWRRWHISLSTFFKDYVYIPLGGNRCSNIKYVRNILVVWGLTGLWHGASWNFIFWGLYFGILILIEKFLLKDFLKKIPKIFRILYTNFFVLISWVLFSFENFTQLKIWFKKLFGFQTVFWSSDTLYYLKNYSVLLIIGIIASTPIVRNIAHWIENKTQNLKLKYVIELIIMLLYIFLFILSVAYLVNDSYNPFLYFRF